MGWRSARLRRARLEERRQRGGGKGERGRVGAAGRIAEQERLAADQRREAGERTTAQFRDLVVAVTADPVAVQRLAHAFARRFGHALRRAVEEMRRSLLPVLVVQPARLQDREIEMILEHALDRPGLRALFGAQPLVEIEAVFLLDMGADEGRIADAVGRPS